LKTVTSAYLGECRKRFGARPIILVKAFYNATSSILISDQYVVVGTDTYNPWLKTIDSIRFSLPELPGLGKLGECSLELVRNATTDNFLTANPKGQKVQIWQWFTGLIDADKLSLATFIIDEVLDVSQSNFTLVCISTEEKLKTKIPSLDLNKTDFPWMPDENIGTPRPIIFGDFSYKKSNGNLWEGSSQATLNRQQEYVQCKKPRLVPSPIFWTDIRLGIGTTNKKKFLAHESANPLAIAVDDPISGLGGQEVMRYIQLSSPF